MNPTRGRDEHASSHTGEDYVTQLMETYKNKISGPILDRMDLWLSVPHVDYETLTTERDTNKRTDETDRAREQILSARARQRKRFTHTGIETNAEMAARDIEETITLSDDVKMVLQNSAQKLKLSPRSYHRLIKVARTIADIDDEDSITPEHVLEALQYRVKL